MVQDCTGLSLSTSARTVGADWDRMVNAFLAHSASTPDHLGRVLTAAPDLAVAWAVKGLFTLLLGRSELNPVAAEALDKAESALGENPATPRERAYVSALKLYLKGRIRGAADRLDAVLEAHPEDALAMKLVHGIRFILGDRRGMLASVERIGEAYADHPQAGYYMGCAAFAAEENGDYDRAERVGRAGLSLAPDDAWGLHAVSHVHDMTARTEDGIRWLEDNAAAFGHCNNFGYHVWWHLGLFYLERGDTGRVLALYDGKIRAEQTDDYRDIANGASMLMRLELEGADVGDRWEELGALAAGRVEDGALVFADLHYLLALDGSAREAEADAMIGRMISDAALADHDMHEVADVAGVPCARGLAAFRSGRYGEAFDLLRAVRPDLQKIGGSHAQRDVFSRLMIEAGIRARRFDEAEAELRDRARRRGAEDRYTARRRAAIAARQSSSGMAAE